MYLFVGDSLVGPIFLIGFRVGRTVFEYRFELQGIHRLVVWGCALLWFGECVGVSNASELLTYIDEVLNWQAKIHLVCNLLR